MPNKYADVCALSDTPSIRTNIVEAALMLKRGSPIWRSVIQKGPVAPVE